MKADTGTRTSFASGKLLLRVCWLRGARGGFRTSQSVSLKHMVPTHKTTLLLSNCPGTDVIPAGDRDNSGSCEFVNVFHRSRFIFLQCLTFFLLFLRARCGFWLGHLCVGRAHGVDQSISCRRGFPKAPLIYLIIFQEVTYYFWEEGGWGVLLHISCWWTVWWLRCSETVGLSRPHFSRAPWIQGTGLWSLVLWQHSRLYLSLCRCVTACSPDLLKVRGDEEVKMPTFFLFFVSFLYKRSMSKKYRNIFLCVLAASVLCMCLFSILFPVLSHLVFIRVSPLAVIVFYERLCECARPSGV